MIILKYKNNKNEFGKFSCARFVLENGILYKLDARGTYFVGSVDIDLSLLEEVK